MYLADIISYIEDYIANSGFPVEDWNVEDWADEARDIIIQNHYASCDGIDADVWTELAQKHAR